MDAIVNESYRDLNVIEHDMDMNMIEQVNYGVEHFKGKKLTRTNDIIDLIKNDVDTIFAITGLPGAGKGGLTKKYEKNCELN